MCVKSTNAEDVKAESLAGRLINQLVWKAVKTYMARQGEGPGRILYEDTIHQHNEYETNYSPQDSWGLCKLPIVTNPF